LNEAQTLFATNKTNHLTGEDKTNKQRRTTKKNKEKITYNEYINLSRLLFSILPKTKSYQGNKENTLKESTSKAHIGITSLNEEFTMVLS